MTVTVLIAMMTVTHKYGFDANALRLPRWWWVHIPRKLMKQGGARVALAHAHLPLEIKALGRRFFVFLQPTAAARRRGEACVLSCALLRHA